MAFITILAVFLLSYGTFLVWVGLTIALAPSPLPVTAGGILLALIGACGIAMAVEMWTGEHRIQRLWKL